LRQAGVRYPQPIFPDLLQVLRSRQTAGRDEQTGSSNNGRRSIAHLFLIHMKNYYSKLLLQIARYFFAAALVAYGVLQFAYGNFRHIFLPPWQTSIPGLFIWADVFGLLLVGSAAAILFNKYARETLFTTGAIMLLFLLCLQIPYELTDPHSYSRHLGSWEGPLKELALAGGVFLVGTSFPQNIAAPHRLSYFFRVLGKLSAAGSFFFSFTMISFGIAHFLYAVYTVDLVPSIFPDHLFWVYFTGTALIGSGVFIILRLRVRTIASLLAGMIFLWILFVHIPGAIAHPFTNRSNAIASAFDALAFTATALLIAIAHPHERTS
jgi:hypothetical protein